MWNVTVNLLSVTHEHFKYNWECQTGMSSLKLSEIGSYQKYLDATWILRGRDGPFEVNFAGWSWLDTKVIIKLLQ